MISLRSNTLVGTLIFVVCTCQTRGRIFFIALVFDNALDQGELGDLFEGELCTFELASCVEPFASLRRD